MTKKSILVVGSSNTDMIIKVQRIPKPGETILGGEFASAAGGKGANQAVSAARAGGAVTFIASVGRDMFGDKAVAGFVADGINVDYIVRDRACPSGVALIFVARNGENSIAVASGSNAKLLPAHLNKARSAFRQAGVVVLQLETPLKTVEAAARLAAGTGARVILNPAPARPLPNDLLRRVYLLTPNETEAELLTGLPVNNDAAAAKAADALLARGVENVIITLGARGAFVAGRQGRGLVRGFKVKPVDTTGAGDVFNGTLAVGLAEGKSLLAAARFASAAAALSVTRLGAQTSAPTRREIDRLLASAGAS
ncbi:MAG TPA: ribokinase [Candidatus Paceibacterota bacterium]|nr:ribokinase [Verrucomicrobiota bacterium]HSA09473.1 ribokinase [Candidatus Paceibacterota bacterium]